MKKVVYWIRYRYLQTFFIYLSVIGISATLCTLWMTTWRVAPLSCELLQAHVQSPSDWTIPTGSLIPRSFPPPVFDSKYRGEGLGDLITLDRQTVDTQGQRRPLGGGTLMFRVTCSKEECILSKWGIRTGSMWLVDAWYKWMWGFDRWVGWVVRKLVRIRMEVPAYLIAMLSHWEVRGRWVGKIVGRLMGRWIDTQVCE